MESTGEDVYLNRRMAEVMVRGYQGENLKNGETVAACVKHFAAYGAPTAGREYTGAELSEQTLRQDYLPAYAAAVRAGAALVMSAFNGVNGRPCTANVYLLRDILRQEMGFDGVVISDWGAVEELVEIGVAEDPLDAARQAFQAGVDVTVAPGCPLLDPGTRFPGRKTMISEETTPETAENWRREAVALAKEADVVLLALGEHPEQSGEAASRTDLTLPKVQLELLEAVRAVNENLVTLIFCGRPLELEPVARNSKALLLAWLPGTEGGHGLADLLFGDACPSGKLSMSFPRRAAQEPIWYSDARNGRQRTEFPSVRYVSGYLDCPDTPLYPFGYGLSYTDFAYGPVSVRENRVEASVKNIRKIAGWETVQLYVQDVTAQVIRPLRELKGFRRIILEPGEEKIISFPLSEEMLAYVHPDGKFYADPGEFRFWIGGDSRTENGCFWHWKGEENGLSQRITGK